LPPEQGRREKRVLPEADSPEDEREGDQHKERRSARVTQNTAGHQQVQRQGRRFENGECRQIRQSRERAADQQEDRRIVEELIGDARLCGCLLGGGMRSQIVYQLRRSSVGEGAGGIEADEIGACRLCERHDPAMFPATMNAETASSIASKAAATRMSRRSSHFPAPGRAAALANTGIMPP
jgi:hypothetical protein